MPPDEDRFEKLEDLKSKLFNKEYKTKIEHRDAYSPLHKKEVLDSWQEEGEVKNINPEKSIFLETSVFKKFFILSIVFFVFALGYAGYVFFAGGNTVSNNNIDISITGDNFTAGGVALPIVVGITNRNSSPLELVDLVMDYPQGSSAQTSSNNEDFRQSLGTIGAGAVVSENLSPILFGEQGSNVTVKISIEYRVAGSNAIFVKEKDFMVTINSTPINLTVTAPPTVSPNQNITLDVKATLNATSPVSQILVKVDYPIGFVFTSSVPAPAFSNNVWSLGEMSPGAEHDISISGKMVGVFNGDQKTFNISTGSESSTDKSMIAVIFNSLQQVVSIQKPFIEADLFVNGVSQGQYSTDSKTPINAQINYVNNLDTKVNNLKIVAKLSGNAFDPKTVQVQQGFYDSSQNTITWDQTSVTGLAQVNPGDSGSVNFSLSPLALFSATNGLLTNPTVNIEVDITGQQDASGFATAQLDNSTSATINVISDVGLSAKVFYYSGPFTNTGPIPPKVGQATTYTVTWTLSNTANSISNVQVAATLPQWMTFSGQFLPAGADVTYNAPTNQIIWNVGRIDKGVGITGTSPSVSFQLSYNPSVSQIGTEPTILNDSILTGHDDFANVDVKVDAPSLDTLLQSDSGFPYGGETVTQ